MMWMDLQQLREGFCQHGCNEEITSSESYPAFDSTLQPSAHDVHHWSQKTCGNALGSHKNVVRGPWTAAAYQGFEFLSNTGLATNNFIHMQTHQKKCKQQKHTIMIINTHIHQNLVRAYRWSNFWHYTKAWKISLHVLWPSLHEAYMQLNRNPIDRNSWEMVLVVLIMCISAKMDSSCKYRWYTFSVSQEGAGLGAANVVVPPCNKNLHSTPSTFPYPCKKQKNKKQNNQPTQLD